jgi:hypothetical protein
MNKLKVCVKLNKDGKKYTALVLDLGYSQKYLSFDSSLCAELLGVSVRSLFETTSEYVLAEFNEKYSCND